MDIIRFVTEHQRAYHNWFMHQTFCAKPKERLKIPTHDENDVDRDDHRFRNSSIIVTFRAQPKTHWATNVIELSKENKSKYTAYIFLDHSIVNLEPELRKAILAEEWLEVMVGIDEPDRRKSKRTSSRTALVELYSSLGRDAHWMDDNEEQLEKRVGLQHLLLPDDFIRSFIQNRYQITVERIKSLSDDDETANQAGRIIRSIERAIAADRFLKVELVQLRLTQFIFSGINGIYR